MCRLTRPSLEDSGPTAKKQDQEAVSSSFFGFKIPHRKSRFPLDSPRCTELFFSVEASVEELQPTLEQRARALTSPHSVQGPRGPRGPRTPMLRGLGDNSVHNDVSDKQVQNERLGVDFPKLLLCKGNSSPLIPSFCMFLLPYVWCDLL